jgi:hypothetical protein
MKLYVKFIYLLFAPVLAILYWKNTMKELGDIHAR